MDITIQRGKSLPDIKKCSDCCSSFHCPFCAPKWFRPTRVSKVQIHLKGHFHRSVEHEGYTIHRCGRPCRTLHHYHCLYCHTTVLRKPDFIKHLEICKRKVQASSATTAPATDSPVTVAPASTAPRTKLGIRVGPELLQKCPNCHLTFYRKNLKRHIQRRHTAKEVDISFSSNFKSECVDAQNGVYAVHKSIHGASTPLHVQLKILGEEQQAFCDSSKCQTNMDLARRSGLQSYQCVHLRSVSNCKTFLSSPSLAEETLTKIVKSKWFGKGKMKVCTDRQTLAKEQNVPLSVQSKIGVPPSKKFISVYEPTVSHYSRLGRVMVSYDTKKNSWYCPCARTKKSCTHKYIAKWHLFQTHPELFSKVQSTETELQVTAPEESNKTDVTHITYPPKDLQVIKGMVKYILMNKKLPAVLPDNLTLPSDEQDYPQHLIPEETLCRHCPESDRIVLSDPVLITHKAKILTASRIIQDVSTYYKYCPRCGVPYRYQEWSDGLHNFNDHILLDLPLCLAVRSMLKVHKAVSRVVEYLESTTGVKFPSADTVLHGYLHFEALTDHKYQFSCVTWGDHPPVVIMDLHKRASFHLSVSDGAQPAEDLNGEVDMELLWTALTEERIARGFVPSRKNYIFYQIL